MYKFFSSKLVGNIIFILIVGGACIFVLTAAKRIQYTWRWNKVPSYIVMKVDEQFQARANGILEVEGESIYILRSTGVRSVVSNNAKPSMPAGTQVYVGDIVAHNKGYGPGPLAKGLFMTLKISAISIVFAIILGIITGLMRVSPIYLFKRLSITYIELVRGTPLLVQIFLLYFFFGKIFNLNEIAAGCAALSIFTGAYIAEIVRAGVQSVSRGQTEAARSLGLSYMQTMRHIILPQALRRTIPPMAGQFISLIKDSSLVSVIAIVDLTKAGREQIANDLNPFEVWFSVAILYLVLTMLLSFVINKLEIRVLKAG